MAVGLLVTAALAINGFSDPEVTDVSLLADGAWAKFQLNEKWSDRSDEIVTEVIVSLVGSKTVKNEIFRWVQLKWKFDDGTDRWHVFTWLAPEKQLKLGGMAAFDANEAYRKSGERKVSKIDIGEYAGRLSYFFSPIAEAKKNGQMETVKWQRGELDCVLAELRKRTKVKGSETIAQHKLRLNSQVPFGVASATIKREFPGGAGSSVDVQFWLIDMGIGAKSIIPLN